MKKLEFNIVIQAPREVVWDVMLTPETYKDWTSEFTEGSYYGGCWNQGESIRLATIWPKALNRLKALYESR